MTTERNTAGNSGFAKKRVQWLIEHSASLSRPEKSLHIKPCKYESKRKKET